MAIQKLVPITSGQTGTHIAADATVVDILNPGVPLADATGGWTRFAAHGVIVAAGTSKYVSGSFIPKKFASAEMQ